MKQYRLVDNIFGWLAFAIAAIVYCSTIEPTASFWDCPEFIVTGYKLEVGHPPGAPFFMLTANLFSQFVSDPAQVAKMVNILSALLSATCILFLFWSITHLARRLILKDWSDLTTGKLIAIEASGMVGALIYTFSDTFWFSAVEGEVYAYSSAFTAVVFWLILKWEDQADQPHSDRWLVLIAYMVGLSIGVHLLNLLCVPAIVLVYYYRKFPNADLKGSILALLVSFVIVTMILYGVVPGIITVGGAFELFFVNTLGCSFNTGLIIYVLLLIATVVWAIYESFVAKSTMRENVSFLAGVAMIGIPFYGYGYSALFTGIVILVILWFVLKIKKDKAALVTSRVKNTIMLSLLMMIIGYSSYALIIIRSSANTPMDQNSPEDIFTLGSYLSRDQYGYRPLLYGQTYSSQFKIEQEDEQGGHIAIKKGAPIYERKEKSDKNEKDSYYVARNKTNYLYEQNMLFPRMYDSKFASAYESWMGGIEGTAVPSNGTTEESTVKIPTQLENLRFFLSYQCNFMYWRYFMWNFAGRQNDIQGNGEPEHGNWITGISFIDNMMYGDQDMLPDDLKNNKGHNVFYCLPLLLGLIGLFWQTYRGKRGVKQFWVVFFLFFMTGLAIVIYLNQTPMQPRERDYAYAGSFYAFAIWCGLGVAAIIDMLKKKIKTEAVWLPAAVAVICLLVPIQMASQTWDDHDRSDRYACRDVGNNYLMSMQEKGNPIIYTNGDNDTFPLWYCQEVEGTRTDSRVCNLSYLQTDWYIDQMKRPAYDSPSLPITWPRLGYCGSTNDYIEVVPELKKIVLDKFKESPEGAAEAFGEEPFELKNVIDKWILSNDPSTHVIPTDTLYITIDKEAVKKSGMLLVDSIPDKMVISLKGRKSLYKGDLMILEMLARANWTRPIYVATTVGSENYMNLDENFVQEGLAYRITPFSTKKENVKDFDTEKVYDNMMNKFKYGNLNKKGIYIDETIMRMCFTHRRLFASLATHLIEEGDKQRALKVLARAKQVLPDYNIPMNYLSGGLDIAKCYAMAGDKKSAKEIIDKVVKNSSQYLDYYTSLPDGKFAMTQHDCQLHLYVLAQALNLADYIDKNYGNKIDQILKGKADTYQRRGGTFPSM